MKSLRSGLHLIPKERALVLFDMFRLTGNRRGEDNAVNAEFQYKYDNEEVKFKME